MGTAPSRLQPAPRDPHIAQSPAARSLPKRCIFALRNWKLVSQKRSKPSPGTLNLNHKLYRSLVPSTRNLLELPTAEPQAHINSKPRTLNRIALLLKTLHRPPTPDPEPKVLFNSFLLQSRAWSAIMIFCRLEYYEKNAINISFNPKKSSNPPWQTPSSLNPSKHQSPRKPSAPNPKPKQGQNPKTNKKPYLEVQG